MRETKTCGDTKMLKHVREGCCSAQQRAGSQRTHVFHGVLGSALPVGLPGGMMSSHHCSPTLAAWAGAQGKVVREIMSRSGLPFPRV